VGGTGDGEEGGSRTAREAGPGGGGREERLQQWSRGSLLHPQEKGLEGGK
jgi:hypothetical protein